MGFDLCFSPGIRHWNLTMCGLPEAKWRRVKPIGFSVHENKWYEERRRERIMYSAALSRILAWEGYGFFFFSPLQFVFSFIFLFPTSRLIFPGSKIHLGSSVPYHIWQLLVRTTNPIYEEICEIFQGCVDNRESVIQLWCNRSSDIPVTPGTRRRGYPGGRRPRLQSWACKLKHKSCEVIIQTGQTESIGRQTDGSGLKGQGSEIRSCVLHSLEYEDADS